MLMLSCISHEINDPFQCRSEHVHRTYKDQNLLNFHTYTYRRNVSGINMYGVVYAFLGLARDGTNQSEPSCTDYRTTLIFITYLPLRFPQSCCLNQMHLMQYKYTHHSWYQRGLTKNFYYWILQGH